MVRWCVPGKVRDGSVNGYRTPAWWADDPPAALLP